MDRFTYSKTIGAFVLCALISLQISAQSELTIEPVKDGLYMIVGPGGNVGVRVTPEGVILIDDKFPRNFDEIQSLVASVSDEPVKYVINSHHHGDHVNHAHPK